ncbi:MAG TPA: ABC transporter permease [Mycobacteriales bacterium]|jgi:ABC-2 type transport system permease protein
MRWSAVLAIAKRHTLVLQRSPHRLFDITIWPIVDTLLFGAIAVFFARSAGGVNGRTGAAYLLCGVLLWHVVFQSQNSLATGFLEETWSRNLLSLMVTPLTEAEWVAGLVLVGLVKLLLGVGLVAVMVAVLYAFNVTSLGLALLPIVAVLLTAGWAIGLFVTGVVLRFGSGAEAFVWGVLFVVMPLSGTFYPTSVLPALLRPLSALLPTTYAFEAARAVIDGDRMPWRPLGIAALTTVVALVLAVAFVRAMLGTFRRRGYVTRYS